MHVSLLPRLVQDANHAIVDQGHAAPTHSDARYADPGGAILPVGRIWPPPLVLCALRFDSAVVSHVGDSRCYLIRNGNLTPLTHDHTMVDRAGPPRSHLQDRSRTAVNRHILTRSLGSELFVAADTITVNIMPGDLLLLCLRRPPRLRLRRRHSADRRLRAESRPGRRHAHSPPPTPRWIR